MNFHLLCKIAEDLFFLGGYQVGFQTMHAPSIKTIKPPYVKKEDYLKLLALRITQPYWSMCRITFLTKNNETNNLFSLVDHVLLRDIGSVGRSL